MTINAAALDLIKSFEGYGKKLPDGRCEAYQEIINGKRDIPTIGYGCTKGVVMGMVWTQAEAEAALQRELDIHEKRVSELVTIELNENERGALVSFDYNCGGLHGNTLKAINSGDRAKAVAAIKLWNKFNGKVANGLERRRAAEVALFLKPVEPVALSFMPQSAEPSPGTNPLHKSGTIWGSVGTAVAGVSVYIEQTFQTLLDTATKWSDFAPIRAMFGDVKLDGKAISFGLLAGCVALIVSRRVKAAQEGKPG